MEIKRDPDQLNKYFAKHLDTIFADFDLKEKETGEKHFVIIRAGDAKEFTGDLAGIAYKFSFHKLNSRELKVLDLETQEAILNTKLNNDVCFLVLSETGQAGILYYKRNK